MVLCFSSSLHHCITALLQLSRNFAEDIFDEIDLLRNPKFTQSFRVSAEDFAPQLFTQNGGGSASPLEPNSITKYAAVLTLASQIITNGVIDSKTCPILCAVLPKTHTNCQNSRPRDVANLAFPELQSDLKA